MGLQQDSTLKLHKGLVRGIVYNVMEDHSNTSLSVGPRQRRTYPWFRRHVHCGGAGLAAAAPAGDSRNMRLRGYILGIMKQRA